MRSSGRKMQVVSLFESKQKEEDDDVDDDDDCDE
jgi:hypothetical protein